MNAKQLGLGIVLIGFSILTAYAVYQYGYLGFFEAVTANVATTTAFVDLVLALGLIMVWIWRDAHERGESPVLYIALTLILGSVGPLLYLIRRFSSERTRSVRLTPQEGRS